jgi:hypothetical protein
MKWMDPCEVVCPTCDTRQSQAVADLLELRAICRQCGSSLAEIGRRMHRIRQEVLKEVDYVALTIADLEEELRVNLPEQASWDDIRTKADFVRAITAFLAETEPAKADPAVISHAFDQSLTRRGLPLPASDSTPLFERL